MVHRSVTNSFDLTALWRAVRVRWLLFTFTVLIFVISGISYSVALTPRYRSEVILLPPTEKDLADFILAKIPIARSDSPEIYDLLSKVEIFTAFKMNLASRSFQEDFLTNFNKSLPNKISSPTYKSDSGDGFGKRVRGPANFVSLTINWRVGYRDNDIFHKFIFPNSETLSISVTTDHTSSRRDLILGATWREPQVAAVIANGLVDFVNKETADQVMDLVSAGIDIRKKNLRDMIASQKNLAEKERQDDIAILREAIDIAKSLEIREPTRAFGEYTIVNITPPAKFFVDPGSKTTPYNPNMGQRYLPLYHPGTAQSGDNRAEFEKNSPPLYTRGWQALEEELRILENRQNNPDPFIPNLRNLQAQLTWIESIDVKDTVLSTVSIARNASPSRQAIAPSHIEILLLSLMFGVFFGILLVLSLHALTAAKNDTT